ncbi:hypothetical protein TNCT_143451 [Trichonephila clavata]|uniref:Uncharacterized protein n=1 Tax=Trichonephila clavata TaxID=2740835 RepID=A0A8X6LIF6_TRICU|nr:hypothetical protein TNCT_143451 [Trichonephila clavata]
MIFLQSHRIKPCTESVGITPLLKGYKAHDLEPEKKDLCVYSLFPGFCFSFLNPSLRRVSSNLNIAFLALPADPVWGHVRRDGRENCREDSSKSRASGKWKVLNPRVLVMPFRCS